MSVRYCLDCIGEAASTCQLVRRHLGGIYFRIVSLIVPLVVVCEDTDLPQGLAIADTAANACSPVLSPGTDDGTIEYFAVGQTVIVQRCTGERHGVSPS